ncbi:MAG TPA: M1 family metallopeptidase [Candidatus Nanoarchaeia archaeon]|nr:M1 family metallopeptidase [Candidatus Nanoarchaeia archaeon]
MKAAQRLVEQIIPNRYKLQLTPDLQSFTFEVVELVDINLANAARELKFHADGLNISSAEVDGQPASINYQVAEQTVAFGASQLLTAGRHELLVKFSGKLRDDLRGFYRSSYETDSQERWLATTQFEATDARACFVCIDEPAAKAIFETVLVIPKNLTAISNTNIVAERPAGDELKSVHFAPTPKMSTYLVAFLVGEFERKSAKTKNGVEVGVVTTPGKLQLTDFALETAVRTLDYYTDYFGLPYPLPKLDMIAVPDFAFGAMENWGAVIYRETAILVDPKQTALANRQTVATVVAHELAHQWFGNLVTMAWWTDLWLNEGFASWVEFLAVDHLFPEWQMWIQFVTDEYAHARDLDSLANTHPIEVEVQHPGEISEIFDAISYQKGASIIRQLHAYIGDESFKTGLHDYLKQNSFKNATTEGLWQALENASGLPVRHVMSAWTRQPGFPLVIVEAGQLHQQRFYLSPIEATNAPTGQLWPIPLQAAGSSQTMLMELAQQQLPATLSSGKLNSDQTAFYVTKYPAGRLAHILDKFSELGALDRFGLVSDSAILTAAGHLSSTRLLELVQEAAKNETEYAVWMGLLNALSDIRLVCSDNDKLVDKLDDFGLKLIKPTLQRLGYEPKNGDPHFDSLLRPQIMLAAARFGDEQVIKLGIDRFNKLVKSSQMIHPDLRLASYMAAARSGNLETYDDMLELFRKTDLQEEKRRFMNGLASFKDASLIERTLNLSMSSEVRSQDSIFTILRVLGNRHGRKAAWRFVQKQWPELVKRYGSGQMLHYLPLGLGSFADNAVADEVEKFFKKNMVPGIERSVQQGLEKIRLQAAWRDRDEDELVKFLV